MAGNLKASELRSVLRRLDSANRALETCIQSLGECQKTLQKSIQCQNYLNHSIQPIKAGFVPNENARTVPGHAAI
ncbi:unnamed protein product [Caretta caretta]